MGDSTDESLRSSGFPAKLNLMALNLKKQLQLLLEAKGWSSAELSRRAKVPKSTLNNWSSGQTPQNLVQLKTVAETLGVSVDHLLFGNGLHQDTPAVRDFSELLSDEWSGAFEIKIRRIKRGHS